jgi:hypothetical protein
MTPRGTVGGRAAGARRETEGMPETGAREAISMKARRVKRKDHRGDASVREDIEVSQVMLGSVLNIQRAPECFTPQKYIILISVAPVCASDFPVGIL